MTASGFAMSEKRAVRYDDAGFRVIRAGTEHVATEYRAPDGRTTQMAGEGEDVREMLRGGRDG
ncbi:hypothetical protein [uncultured Novosphingobium sp.]|uniref:hypothetical protein n=1 Tax=uncultured Novosphingobium sp. TaxID=292277 RepID=UPI0037496825